MRKLLLAASALALTLTGCAGLPGAEQIKTIQTLEDGSYYLHLSRPWVSRTAQIRDQALDVATQECAQKNMGMQPGEIVTRHPGQENAGATAHLTYRCVAILPTPEDEKITHRLGFYKDAESRDRINQELDKEMLDLSRGGDDQE